MGSEGCTKFIQKENGKTTGLMTQKTTITSK